MTDTYTYAVVDTTCDTYCIWLSWFSTLEKAEEFAKTIDHHGDDFRNYDDEALYEIRRISIDIPHEQPKLMATITYRERYVKDTGSFVWELTKFEVANV